MNSNDNYEDATPKPEYLIKSISEQGYSFEASIADLIDNSISADARRVEVVSDHESEPYRLYIADDGNGMSLEKLKESMQFPSASPDAIRRSSDLGRFGLGMKTASFSQTRRFTVISRKKGEDKYDARTWDVEVLKKTEKWNLIINTKEEVNQLVSEYIKLSTQKLGEFDEYKPNTIVVWQGLYKFEEYIYQENRKKAFERELTDVASEHLSLVFHRFMEKNDSPVEIRINNHRLLPINPFPESEKNFRKIPTTQRDVRGEDIFVEGYVLPSRAVGESKSNSVWTTKRKSLMDMEGVYIYRADRIISFGGWNGLTKKAPRLQLARLKVDIGNQVDQLLHLNVAKSQVIIPHDLKPGFIDYVEQLKSEAIKEYYNRGNSRIKFKQNSDNTNLFEKVATGKGALLDLNKKFPLYKELYKTLNDSQTELLEIMLKMIITKINSIRNIEESRVDNHIYEKQKSSGEKDLGRVIERLESTGMDFEFIKEYILPEIGVDVDNLPEGLMERFN
jgi:hypothetical protein